MDTQPPAPGGKRRVLLMIGIIALVTLLLPAIPAKAVYNGILDGNNRYSNVGFVFTERTNPHNDVTGGGPPDVLDDDLCDGVLIAADLVLTAGSCVNDPWDDYAYFSPVPDFDPLYDYGATDDGNQLPFLDDLRPYQKGDNICDPETCFRGKIIKASSSFVGGHDLAVLKLSVDLVKKLGIKPAQLPAYNSLNNLVGAQFTIVGYGHVNCAGGGCPPDDDVFFDDDPVHFPEWDTFENSVIQDQTTDPPAWWRHINLTERRYAVMQVIAQKGEGDQPNNSNRFFEMKQTDHKYSCIDQGGPYFRGTDDPNGTLVAINWDRDCSPVTDVLRLDTPNAKNFFCSKQFSELASSPLCAGSKDSTQATKDDGGKHAADHKHKNSGGKHHTKGHHKGKHHR